MLKMQPEVASETSDMARKKTSSKSATQKPTSRAAVRKLSAHKPSPVKSAAPKGQPAKVQAKRPSKPVAAKVDQTKKLVAAKKIVAACQAGAGQAAGQGCARGPDRAQAGGCRQAAHAPQGRRHQAGHGSRCRP